MGHRVHADGRGPCGARSGAVPCGAGRTAGLLALQRTAGNRAVAALVARRVIGERPEQQVVRFQVGVELTPKLAETAWQLTKKGALDEHGIAALRAVALEHWNRSIDDNERLFIAALLDPGNARTLHDQHPSGFSADKTIEFRATSITAANRRTVRDFGRATLPQASPGGLGADALDRVTIAMGGKQFGHTVARVLALADTAGVSHLQVHYAMLNAASDSTEGDRALAGAAYVIARREEMPMAKELMAGNLKIDEVSPEMLKMIDPDARAGYVPTADAAGSLKSDTIYLPSTFDVDSVADQGTLIHELQHAIDDWLVLGRVGSRTADYEMSAYRRQARFLIRALSERTGAERTKVLEALARSTGPVLLHLMVAEAQQADDEAAYSELRKLVTDLNSEIRVTPGGAGLDPGDLADAWRATAEANRAKARTKFRKAHRAGTLELEGLTGESVLDRKPPSEATPAGGVLQRQPAPKVPQEFEQAIAIGGIDHQVKGGPKVSSGITEALLIAAQKLLAKGPITIKDLRALRAHALGDATVSDAERLFLAALLDPQNAERVKAIDLDPTKRKPLKLRFTLDDTTAQRIREVSELGRPAAGKGAFASQILALAGETRRKSAQSLLKFATERKVPEADVLEAMRMAGSDATPGDMVAAGSVYAIAAASGHPLAADLKAGLLKVDEMHLSETEGAHYSPTGFGGVKKGDTLYVKPSFDVSKLLDRATTIHELEHALQDRAEKAAVEKSVGVDLEPAAYIAGARHVLQELAAMPVKSRAAVVKQVAAAWPRWQLLAAVIASRADAKLRPVLDAINAALDEKDRITNDDFAGKDDELRARIASEIDRHGSRRALLTGLSGESVFHLKRLPRPAAPAE